MEESVVPDLPASEDSPSAPRRRSPPPRRRPRHYSQAEDSDPGWDDTVRAYEDAPGGIDG